MAKYFGTDGIRGKFGDELTTDLAYKVGQSLAGSLDTKTLIIGCDTRESSYVIMKNLAMGAKHTGVNVQIAGVVPTPIIAHYSTINKFTGIMITASHNPYHDNGIKVFNKGFKLSAKEEALIEDFIDNKDEIRALKYGKIENSDLSVIAYRELFKSMNIEKSNFNVGIDSAHGANYLLSKELMSGIVNRLVQVGNKPDGRNINNDVGSTHLDSIKNVVISEKLDFGLSFDGDGDRVLLVDSEAKVIDGDELIYIIATYLKNNNLLNKDTVVLTSMSNLGIIKSFERLGIKVVLTDVGDKYVLEAITNNNYSVGGENSGHIILKDYLNTGDGLLVASFLIKILHETGKTLNQLIEDITMFPQKMVNIKTRDKEVINKKEVLDLIENTKKEWGSFGKVLIRASGTEPLVRITLSYENEDVLDIKMNEFIELINKLKEV